MLNFSILLKIQKPFKLKIYIPSQLFTEDIVIGESLVLEKVTREDMGKYMCIARNTVQPAASKIFDLSVNCKYYKIPQAWYKILKNVLKCHITYKNKCMCLICVLVKPQIMVPHKIIGTPVDSGIELKCRIEASPKPITVWSRKKGILTMNSVT